MSLFKSTVLASALMLSANASFASDNGPKLTDEIKAKITQQLTEQGYSVGKIKTEDDAFEAYAKKEGKKYEIYLDESLNVIKIKED